MAFLSYDPSTNDFVWVESEEDIFFGVEKPSVPIPIAGTSIKDIMRGTGGSGTPPTSGLPQVGGSIFRAAAGFKAFGTVKDVLSAPVSPIGLAFSAFEGVSEFKKGIQRAEVFEQADKPTATVGDLLAASNLEPTLLDYGKNLLGIGLDLFTGNVAGLALGSGPQLATTIAADFKASESLEKAGQLEQEIISKGIPAEGTIGYINTIANFKEMQAANLAAASTATEEEGARLASLTPVQDIINSTISQGVSTRSGGLSDKKTIYERTSSGDLIQRDNFSGGGSFSQNLSENQRTQERRESEGHTGSTAAQRRGTSGSEMSSGDFGGGSGGFSGGSGAGGFEGDIGGGDFGGFA